MDKIYIHCDKSCIANLNGECCLDECKGQISSLKPMHGTAEQLKKFYEATKKIFSEDFEDEKD